MPSDLADTDVPGTDRPTVTSADVGDDSTEADGPGFGGLVAGVATLATGAWLARRDE